MKQKRRLGSAGLSCLGYVAGIYLISIALLSGNVVFALITVYGGIALVMLVARLFSPCHYKRMTYRAEHNIQPKPINVPAKIVPWLSLAKFLFTFFCIRLLLGYRLSDECAAYRTGAWLLTPPGVFARHLSDIGAFEIDTSTLASMFWTDVQFACLLLLLFLIHYIDLRCAVCRLYPIYINIKPKSSEEKKNVESETTAVKDGPNSKDVAERVV